MERKYSEEAGRRSCASSPACADVVIGRVCLEVMVYESASGVGLLLGAALSCQLPSLSSEDPCFPGMTSLTNPFGASQSSICCHTARVTNAIERMPAACEARPEAAAVARSILAEGPKNSSGLPLRRRPAHRRAPPVTKHRWAPPRPPQAGERAYNKPLKPATE